MGDSNIRALTLTFDFPRKALVYEVGLKSRRELKLLRERAAENGLLEAKSRIALTFSRKLNGRIVITFSGPAIAHIYKALPVLGAPMTISRADQRREALDRQMQTRTTFFVRDAAALVDKLCA